MKRLSVRARINVVSLLPLLLAAVLVFAISGTMSRLWIMRAFQAEHAGIAQLQAHVLADQAARAGLEAAKDGLDDYLALRPEMRAAAVTDLVGRRIWESARDQSESARTLAAAVLPPGEQVHTAIEGSRLYLTARITTDDGAAVGLLHASISTEPVYEAIYANLAGLAASIALALAVGLFLIVRFRAHLTTAVENLVEATRKIAGGQLSVYIPHHTDDELGELATSIEKMAEQLQNREDQLRQAQAAAEGASHAKTQFLTHMNHEIRNPLTAIISNCELLRDGDAASQIEASEAVARNARHLQSLISETLDLAKVEAGMMTVESIPAAPAEILRDVVGMMRRSAQDKGLKLELKLGAGLSSPITTDPTRLRQIILNLLSNAVKFTNRGAVTISAEIVASQPPMLRVSVQDTGIGIAPERVRELFKPFTQAEASTTRCYGGTGIGLALAQRMAGLLGGSILVESTPGQGSVFTVQVLAYPAVTQEEAAAPKSRRSSGMLAGARIIVVEDAVDTQRVLKVLLEREGAMVKTANNGQEAVDFLSNYDLPCVVLMDIQMPVLDGFEATRQLRELGFTCPIIAVTGQTTLQDRERCLAAGCNDFLPKPIRREELIQLLAGWVAHATAERSAWEEQEQELELVLAV